MIRRYRLTSKGVKTRFQVGRRVAVYDDGLPTPKPRIVFRFKMGHWQPDDPTEAISFQQSETATTYHAILEILQKQSSDQEIDQVVEVLIPSS